MEDLLQGKGSLAVKQASWDSGRVTIPGDTSEICESLEVYCLGDG